MAHIPSLVKTGPIVKVAKPLLSNSAQEARRRVLDLYRTWWREVPTIVEVHALDLSHKEVRTKVRQEFEKNRYIEDIRVIDMMVVKGRLELDETIQSRVPRHRLTKILTRNMGTTARMRKLLRGLID